MQNTWRWLLYLVVVPWLGCGYEMEPSDDAQADVTGTRQALIGPDGDLHDFPPWIWPYIRTASIFTHTLGGKLSVKEANIAMKAAAEDCGCALGSSKATLATALAAVDTTFDTQYSAARLAVVAGRGADPEPQPSLIASAKLRGSAALSGDGYCGTAYPPFPWPRPRGMFDLLLNERELLENAVLSNVKLDAAEQEAVHSAFDRQVERFKALEL